jgi:hypothetical protein
VDGFGKNAVIQGRDEDRAAAGEDSRVAHIAQAVVPESNWGN